MCLNTSKESLALGHLEETVSYSVIQCQHTISITIPMDLLRELCTEALLFPV